MNNGQIFIFILLSCLVYFGLTVWARKRDGSEFSILFKGVLSILIVWAVFFLYNLIF